MCGGIAAIDYDNDGLMDLFFTNGAKLPELAKTSGSYFNCMLHNRGDGTFEDVTEKTGLAGKDLGYTFGVAAGDFDNDGNEDLFVAAAGRNALYRNNGDGTFTDVTANSDWTRNPTTCLAWVPPGSTMTMTDSSTSSFPITPYGLPRRTADA